MDPEAREALVAIERSLKQLHQDTDDRSEVLLELASLRKSFEEVRADVRAIATKIWRGNGGSSILERLASLETAIRRSSSPPASSIRLWILSGAVALVIALTLLAWTLGHDNVRLLLEALK